jgi:hypothetical protein
MPELDRNEESIAVTQALGHWLCVLLSCLAFRFPVASSSTRYYRLVHQGYPPPMPMLPDTLGTRAFLKAASSIWVHSMSNGVCLEDQPPVRLLSLLSSARQDSGSLSEFKEVRRMVRVFTCSVCSRICLQILAAFSEYTHPTLSMMASEIDDKDSLSAAHTLGYKTYGTGGFMGDSEKVWPVTETKFSASTFLHVDCVSAAAQALFRYGCQGCQGLHQR